MLTLCDFHIWSVDRRIFNVKWCSNMGTQVLYLKTLSRDSLAFVSFTTMFSSKPKARCIVCFWAFWTQYLSNCFDLHVVAKPDQSAYFDDEDLWENLRSTKESKDLALLVLRL
jgi:hypothetical protein